MKRTLLSLLSAAVLAGCASEPIITIQQERKGYEVRGASSGHYSRAPETEVFEIPIIKIAANTYVVNHNSNSRYNELPFTLTDIKKVGRVIDRHKNIIDLEKKVYGIFVKDEIKAGNETKPTTELLTSRYLDFNEAEQEGVWAIKENVPGLREFTIKTNGRSLDVYFFVKGSDIYASPVSETKESRNPEEDPTDKKQKLRIIYQNKSGFYKLKEISVEDYNARSTPESNQTVPAAVEVMEVK